MDKETEKILIQISRHRNKAIELLTLSRKLHEQSKSFTTTQEEIDAMGKIIEWNKEACSENAKANKLTDEYIAKTERKE
jgi:K+/H+ antiporter YhaU regulatory subunit KhtT